MRNPAKVHYTVNLIANNQHKTTSSAFTNFHQAVALQSEQVQSAEVAVERASQVQQLEPTLERLQVQLQAIVSARRIVRYEMP